MSAAPQAGQRSSAGSPSWVEHHGQWLAPDGGSGFAVPPAIDDWSVAGGWPGRSSVTRALRSVACAPCVGRSRSFPSFPVELPLGPLRSSVRARRRRADPACAPTAAR
jgi:hypothetical protein